MIPPVLAQTILDVHPDGAEWLAQFPAQLTAWHTQWHVRLESPFPNLSYHYVAPGIQAPHTPIVLKAGPPSASFQREVAALRAYAGRSAVRLLAADTAHGAMLLTRIMPGTPLIEEKDDVVATEIAARVMQQLWRTESEVHTTAPVPSDSSKSVGTSAGHEQAPVVFPNVTDWAAGLQRLRRRFEGGTGPLPPRLVHKAEQLFAELLASMDTPVLLHGDLHHENILALYDESGQTHWRAIDPKGVWGEPAYEPGAWMRNPMSRLVEWCKPQAILDRRLAQFSEQLALDRQRIAAWAFAQAVLSAWWSLEDHPASEPGQVSRNDGWRRALMVAEWLDPLTP